MNPEEIFKQMDRARKAFEAHFSGLNHFEKAMRSQSRLLEQINKFTDPYSPVYKQIDKIMEPQRILQEHMNKLNAPLSTWQDKIDKIFEPQRRFQEHIDKIIDPIHSWQKNIDRITSQQHHWQQRLENLHSSEQRWQKIFNQFIDGTDFSSINIDPSGSVSISGEDYTSIEVHNSINDFKINLETTNSLDDYLTKLHAFLLKLKKPLAVFLLILIIPYMVSVFANLTTPIYEQWWIDHTSTTKHESIKKIRENAITAYDKNNLLHHRFTIAKILHVRSTGHRDALIIDELPFGKVVTPIKRKKRWTLIEYFDDDSGETYTGWVFSRYLAKFNI